MSKADRARCGGWLREYGPASGGRVLERVRDRVPRPFSAHATAAWGGPSFVAGGRKKGPDRSMRTTLRLELAIAGAAFRSN
jgi:hypothetical protein